jgi:hypothetical protein
MCLCTPLLFDCLQAPPELCFGDKSLSTRTPEEQLRKLLSNGLDLSCSIGKWILISRHVPGYLLLEDEGAEMMQSTFATLDAHAASPFLLKRITEEDLNTTAPGVVTSRE